MRPGFGPLDRPRPCRTHGLRDVDEGRAAIRDAAAEIVVLVEQKDVFVEAAEPQKKFATDEETGAGEERRAGLAVRHRELAAAGS